MNSRGRGKPRFGFKKRRGGPRFSHRGNENTPREFRHTEQLSEMEVGITEYISNLEGFTGVIKERYSDFQVNEVDLNGQLAVLTNTDIPKEKNIDLDFNTIDESPLDDIPQSIWNEIKEVMKNNSKESIKLLADTFSKDDRRRIHLKMKEIFGTKIIVDTVLENEKKFLTFRKATKEDRTRPSWPADRGDYVHFLVYKEALDTMNACYQIAEATRIGASQLSYAGIKDKRGKTTQWFSAKKVEPWKLITKTRKIKHLKIGNITFKDTPIKLGDLNGNRFRIVLKNVVADNDIVEKAAECLRGNGFINYYGLQRFGNDKEVPTFSIGLQLLLGNWQEACKLILKPKTSDEMQLDISKAKKLYAETGDPKEAYKCLENNKNNCVEAKLLEGLSKEHKNEFVNALTSIPRNMRLLYIHSFQSLIWNKMVSQRIKKFGLKPVEGDFVVINDCYANPDLQDVEDETEKQEDSDKEIQSADIEPKSRPEIKALTESDLSQYTIFDVVLPLPGYDVNYPENMKEEYKEELEKHGLTLEMPKQSVKTYTLSGAYRKILGKVQDFKWRTMRYNEPNDCLILSDFDVLRKFTEPVDMPDGKYKAVILELTLDSASYATMVLREIMKVDTSPSAQIKLNDYGKSANKSKKIGLANGSAEEKLETIDASTSGSLLNNEEKLEEFKKSIFNESIVKRKNEDDEEVNKKIRTE